MTLGRIWTSPTTSAPHSGQGTSIIKWVIIVLAFAIGVVGIVMLSRGREKGENYISREAKIEAQTTGKDPCDIL